MNLNEITGIKTLKGVEAKDLITKAELFTGRVHVIGHGNNGIVLSDGKNIYKFWIKDAAYSAFVEACQGTTNPWLPVFKSRIRTLKKFYKGHDVSFVKMEKLSEVSNNGQLYFAPFADRKVHFNLLDVIDCSVSAGLGNSPEDFMDLLLTTGFVSELTYDEKKNLRATNPKPSEQLKSLFAALKLIEALKDKTGADSDTGADGNILTRGQQPVFADPIVTLEDLDFNDGFLDLYS